METDEELAELEHFLCADRAMAVAPELLDHRPSRIVSDEVLACCFAPPGQGWPWLNLFRWPCEFQQVAYGEGVSMARDCYTIELAERESDAQLNAAAVLEQLASRHRVTVRMLAVDRSGNDGTLS